jgi:uncharacterized protein YifN (PemK superfamily)
MVYSTGTKVREILGIEESQCTDAQLSNFLSEATLVIIRRISVRELDEEPEGAIDGSNKTFRVSKAFIADTDGDSIVNASDVTVFTWTDADDENTKNEVVVQTVNPLTGRIDLVTAPASSIAKITVSYSWYPYQIDFNLLERACAYYTASRWALRELAMLVSPVRVGNMATKWDQAWLTYEKEFEKYIRLVQTQAMTIVEYTRIFTNPRSGQSMKMEDGVVIEPEYPQVP